MKMKKCSVILAIMYILIVFAAFPMKNFSRPLSAYLSQWENHSIKVFTLNGDGDCDSTQAFQPKVHISVLIHVEGGSDSVAWRIVAKAGPNNHRDSTHVSVPVDTATVSSAGSHFLRWNVSGNYFLESVAADDVYFVITSTTGNAAVTSGNIRVMGLEE